MGVCVEEEEKPRCKTVARICKWLPDVQCVHTGNPPTLTCLRCIYAYLQRKVVCVGYLNAKLQECLASEMGQGELYILSDLLEGNLKDLVKVLESMGKLLHDSGGDGEEKACVRYVA